MNGSVGFLLATALGVTACGEGSPGIALQEPWIRATAPFANTAALYTTIRNSTAVDDRLLTIDSPSCEEFEVHRTELDRGTASMTSIEGGLRIDAGASVLLEPGGTHGMCLGLAGNLSDGDEVRLRLTFQNSESISVLVPVRRN